MKNYQLLNEWHLTYYIIWDKIYNKILEYQHYYLVYISSWITFLKFQKLLKYEINKLWLEQNVSDM